MKIKQRATGPHCVSPEADEPDEPETLQSDFVEWISHLFTLLLHLF